MSVRMCDLRWEASVQSFLSNCQSKWIILIIIKQRFKLREEAGDWWGIREVRMRQCVQSNSVCDEM